MLDWTQSTQQPDPSTPAKTDLQQEHGRPPALDRACYICGQRAWRWNPEIEGYECASGDPAHAERAQWLKDTFPHD